jgi:hypothetical protein
VNILDENILESQRQLLRSWRIPIRQIGVDLAEKGMADEQALPLLLTLPSATFFTRDLCFANSDFCHAARCLVVLAVGQYEVAHFVRRVLRHPLLDSKQKRMGLVIRAMPTGLSFMRSHSSPVEIPWDS